jgi:phosphohistidine phosphatase SixA
MHSRLNIPALAGIKVKNDATRKLTMSSKDGAEAQAKAYQRTSCREKFFTVSPVTRTVNRHRWVSVSALRRARETSLRNSAH